MCSREGDGQSTGDYAGARPVGLVELCESFEVFGQSVSIAALSWSCGTFDRGNWAANHVRLANKQIQCWCGTVGEATVVEVVVERRFNFFALRYWTPASI